MDNIFNPVQRIKHMREEYIKRWNPETKDNIFTFRFKAFEETPLNDNTIVSTFTHYIKNKKISRLLVFKEGKSKYEKLHYHIIVETSVWNTRQSCHDFLKREFPYLKGNAMKSVHECKIGNKVFDKDLVSNKTYCAKEGDLIMRHGYSKEQIKKIIEIGAAIHANKNMVLWRKIIFTFELKKIVTKLTSKHIKHIHTCCTKYFEKELDKHFLNNHTNKNLIKNILCELCPAYYEAEGRGMIREIYNDGYHN